MTRVRTLRRFAEREEHLADMESAAGNYDAAIEHYDNAGDAFRAMSQTYAYRAQWALRVVVVLSLAQLGLAVFS